MLTYLQVSISANGGAVNAGRGWGRAFFEQGADGSGGSAEGGEEDVHVAP
jgi:hypothetical protein